MFVDNLNSIQKRCAIAQNKYKKATKNICILAVSKTQKPEALAEAVYSGHRNFAENYLQELEQHVAYLDGLSLSKNIEWHFIGHIQSKKARSIASLCSWVHSVDRLSVAQKLNQYRSEDMPKLNICIQVNLDNEESKSGVLPNQVVEFSREVNELSHIVVRGLMAIPKPHKDFDGQRRGFAKLYDLKSAVASQVPTVDSLSMGMSDDFEAAIAEGSTMIRIGTALFGQRQKSATVS